MLRDYSVLSFKCNIVSFVRYYCIFVFVDKMFMRFFFCYSFDVFNGYYNLVIGGKFIV